MRTVFVLVNPVSGRRKYKKVLAELEATAATHGIDLKVHFTTATCNAEATISSKLDETFTDLIILGGDGTLNEAINGLNHSIPLGIIPTGSGNDYAKCFDFGATAKEQIQTALFGKMALVDTGLCNGRKFLNGVGIGFDGQIVADMVREKTMIQGPAKYYYHVLKILSSYKPRLFRYTDDQSQHEKKLILLCVAKGTTFGGSFMLTPHAQQSDGLLHICEIGEVSPARRFLNVPGLMKGQHDKLKEVRFFTTKTLTIEEQPKLNAHIDGEFFGSPPFHFSVEKGSLQIRVGD